MEFRGQKTIGSTSVALLYNRESKDFIKPSTKGENMKRSIVLAVILCLSLATFVFAQDDIAKHKSCKYCGMDREKFAFSRVLIEYEDGTAVGTCSIHCAAIDLATNIDKTPKVIWVGDFKTKELIDVEKAFWVIGGSKMGVMTKNAKWAFGKSEDAKEFMAANGGDPGTFDQAMKAAFEDMYADTKMIRDKRKAMKQTATEQKPPKP
jgi:copper chaperone NosL